MNTGWMIALLVMAFTAAVLSLAGRKASRWRWAIVCGAVLAVAAWWTLWKEVAQRDQRSRQTLLQNVPRQGRPDGFVSSEKCEACHPNHYHSWHESYHRTMTQIAARDTVLGKFDDVTLERAGRTFRLQRAGNEFWVEMDDPETSLPTTANIEPARIRRRVGMLTGSHHMQVYWVPGDRGNLQMVFPFAYLLDDQRWVPFQDTFLRDPKLSPSPQVWNVNCINCHSTGGQPRPDRSTRVLNTRVGELGIACESCHGPAEHHVRANQNPLRRYRLHQQDQPDPTIFNPARHPAKIASQVCGQCHGIKWIFDANDWGENGFRYRPGDELDKSTPIVRPTRLDAQPWLREPLKARPTYLAEHYWSDGMVRVSGREFNGLVESPCYQRGKLSCLSCHIMHQPAGEPRPVRQWTDDQLRLGPESNEACFQCHSPFRGNLERHTHHVPNSTGSQCYNCHMPHTTYGLLKAIRSHQINNPAVKESLDVGRPNACNLCHLDKSLGWTAKHLSAWYGQNEIKMNEDQENIAAAVLWVLKGDAGQRALLAWHMGWPSAKKISGEQWLAPFLATLLEDPYSAVRYVAHRSLRRLPGFESFEFDFVGPVESRTKARRDAMEIWRSRVKTESGRAGEALLLNAAGNLQQENFARLLKQRDDRSMDLQE